MNTEMLLNYKATFLAALILQEVSNTKEEKGVVISGTHITDLPSLSCIKLKYL